MEFQYGDMPNYTTLDGSVKIQKESEVRMKIIGTRVDAIEIEVGVNLFEPNQKLYPLTLGVDATKDAASKDEAGFCIEESMDANKVKGKVVHCKLNWNYSRGVFITLSLAKVN